jgi:hypothetical protein
MGLLDLIQDSAQALAEWLGGPASPAPDGVVREIHDVRGFRVVVENTRPDIATADVLVRLGEALDLIGKYQPWRLRHLECDLKQILVVRFPCRGAYIPDEQSCVTELTFLARRDIGPETVASSIVHEGVHARVDRCGVKREGRDRAREERLCRRAEVSFGRALPPEIGRPVLERALGTLTLADDEVAPSIDWREATARQDAIDRSAAIE